MVIYTQEDINPGPIDRDVQCWPNLYPVMDAISPDKPILRRITGTIAHVVRGNETRLNQVQGDIRWIDARPLCKMCGEREAESGSLYCAACERANCLGELPF